MKYCLPQPYAIVCISCLYPPLRHNRFKMEELPEKITEMVAINFHSSVYDLKGRSRKREHVNARQISMSLISVFAPKLKLTEIGRMFNRDHSTVIYSKETVGDLCDTDKRYKRDYMMLYDRVKSFIDKAKIEADLAELNIKNQQ